MNMHVSHFARNSARVGLLWLTLALALLPGAARAADSFVDPLSGFEPVDAIVDPQDGTTIVLGNANGAAAIRRYDTTGGEVPWGLLPADMSNAVVVRTLTGVTPVAMFVGTGTTNNLYIVGGSKITRVNKATGEIVATANGPSQLSLRDVYVQGNQVYLCGTLSGAATVFGVSATARGSMAGIVFRLDASLTGNALALATFGMGGNNSAESLVVDEAGNIYVAGGLEGNGTFGSDFGLTGKWQVRQAKAISGVPITSLVGAVELLNGANQSGTPATASPDVINYANDGQFPNANQNDFALRATGLISLPPGRYIFHNRTDDGSYLKIDGTTVIHDDTLHPPEYRSGERFIGPGLHSVEFVMFEHEGGAVAQLEYEVKGTGVKNFLRTASANGGNKGYVFKLSPDLTSTLGVYFTSENAQSLGGSFRELHYAQGWVYAVGFWKGRADNPLIGFPDDSTGDTEDVEIIKLDTDLVAKGRATVKGQAHNQGFSVSSDEGGNVYFAGNFGSGSVDFFGESDRSSTTNINDTPSMSISASKRNLFVAKLNQHMDYEWVRSPRLPADGYSPDNVPRVRWNQQLQRLFWVGYISAGTMVMGEPESEKLLASPKGFVAVFDPDGRFTERVNLTIISEFGQSETQVLPFGGPDQSGNGTSNNTRLRIKGSEIFASVPQIMYKDLTNGDLTLSGNELADAQLIDDRAETRVVSAGYSVDDNVPVGDANSYRFILQQDTTVTFNWDVEYALTIKSDFTETVGTHISGISSDASGNPVPTVKKHWIPRNDTVISSIDSELPDLNNPILPVKYVITGYRAFGAATNVAIPTAFPFYAYTNSELRRQVPEFVMNGPAKITNVWKLKIGVQVNTTGQKSSHLPLVYVVKDSPSAVGTPTQSNGVGVGTFFFNEKTRLEIATVRNEGAQSLKGWDNGDGIVFQPSGTLTDLTPATIGGKQYSSKFVFSMERPARVLWDYGDRIFEETVNIGNPVTFSTVDDPSIFATLLTNQAPSRVEVVQGPQGSGGDEMAIWDDVGKKLYPLRPGVVMSFWKASTDPDDLIIIRLNIRYPDSPHYNHIASTPPVRLDAGTNDLVRFRQMKFTETGTGAAATPEQGFTATGPGRTVLLFSEISSPGRAGELETLRVRVVNTRLWNDALPAPVTAIIGRKITSAFDTAGLGTGFAFFEKARYNPFIYNRMQVQGPIIPVNLHPTAQENEQLVVVWYEKRDKLLWPYKPVRYLPTWPTPATGLQRIVIASRFGNESVATNGTDQLVAPQTIVGTNLIPAENAFNPTRFQQVQIYHQPDTNVAGYNPNEEHALMAPSLRYADVSPRPMAAYALRDNDLNITTNDFSYTSDPYVLVQYLDLLDSEFKMKVYNVKSADEDRNLGDLSYRYAFEQEMEAGEPVIPFYPLPFVIGATPCGGSYGKEGDPSRRVFWKDHKGTGWAVSGDGFFNMYFMYPLLVDFWWPEDFPRNPGDCVPFLPIVPANTLRGTAYGEYRGTNFFRNVDYRLPNQNPAAQQIRYTTIWPQAVPVLKVGETLTFSGGEYSTDNPLTVVETPEGDIDVVDTPGLPGIVAFAAGEIVFDTLNPTMNNQTLFSRYTARIIQGLEQRTVDLPLAQFPAALQPANGRTRVRNGKYYFSQLPSSLQKRVFYDPILGKLGIQGFLNDKNIGDSTLTAAPGAVYVLEPNIMTTREGQLLDGSVNDSPLVDLSGTIFATKARELFNLARNPNQLDQNNNGVDVAYRVGLEQEIIRNANGVAQTQTGPTGIVSVQREKKNAANLQALGPGLALVTNPSFLDPRDPSPDISYITIAENNSPSLGGAPVTLFVIKVDKRERYRGAIKTVLSDNVFDENIVLRHTGDFGANADALAFEWWYRPEDGTTALTPDLQPSPNPWKLFGDPSGKQGVGFYQLTLKGNPSAPEALLADSLFFLRYRHTNDVVDGVDWAVAQPNGAQSVPFQWAGAGNSSPNDIDGDGFPDYQPQLAEGWVKRVLRSVNPYEARIRDFTGDNPATYASMLRQLGQRFEGPVALNPAQNVIENVGLIELYETIFRRAMNLSIDLSTPISTPGIANALQLASTRLGDFYMLLGNEAHSDAQNPTIGFDIVTFDLYGYLAPSLFAFQNQMASPLDEELALLRGVDGFFARPVYNRLFWNFTSGEGEAAYAQNYNVTDVNLDGFIDEKDGQILYPQGHGDAWGHYLTALRYQYELLTHRFFNWVSRSEFVNIQDIVVAVDYLDERKFAQIAAAKARAGAEVVNMTYREKFVSNPDGQWQGYLDTDKNRAWGFEEWARRAGQGAYFDWVTANALLPAVHPNTNLTGIAKVDRTTVKDIAQIAGNLALIQAKVEEASAGNNPLGVAKGTILFDIDPTFLEVGSTAQIGTRAVQGLFHFDQIFERALQALKNARAIFENASSLNNAIRQVANGEEEFRINVFQEDLAYRNQLIELFGTPYEGTIGSGKAYPAGYQGPDVMLFAYVDVRQINSSTVPRQTAVYSANYNQAVGSSGLLRITNTLRTLFAESFQGTAPNSGQIVNYTDFSNASGNPPRLADSAFAASLNLPISTAGYTFQAPPEWGRRASPGELQALLSQLLQAEGDVAASIAAWDALSTAIVRSLRLVNARYDMNAAVRARVQSYLDQATGLASSQHGFTLGANIAQFIGEIIDQVGHDIADSIESETPTVGFAVSLGGAPLELGAIVVKLVADVLSYIPKGIAIGLNSAALRAELDRELAGILKDLEVGVLQDDFALKEALVELENLVGDEGIKRVEIFNAVQHMREVSDQYRAKLAEGIRLIQEREYFNKRTAAMAQRNRYQDISFRMARNAALEKYRSAFDLASRYVYIAAATYDYETNLRPDDAGSPSSIFEEIIRSRTLGISNEDGQPASGGGGLYESLAILKANYDLLKTRMSFNQPQIEFATFSLRYELFRIPLEEDETNGTANAEAWRTELSKPEHYKDDLWQVPEFRQYCRPFAAATNGPQPGLVIPFSSYIISGSNFFGWPLGGGDSAYDPSHYSTKVNAVGVWFDGYPADQLSATPRMYFIPVGADIITVPNSQNLDVRIWNVREQSIPVPFPATTARLNDTAWRPLIDSLPTPFGEIRRFSSFRAYGYTQDDLDGGADPEGEITYDNRLVARSVWNTRWLLIIPGATLSADAVDGLKTFLHGPLVNPADDPATGERDGNGVKDIKLVIRTYSFSGN